MRIASAPFRVNGRDYAPPPRPLAAICLDGCDDAYLEAAFADGRMPRLAAMVRRGYRGMACGATPSFTNVNNAAIVAGVPPAATGIGGNFFLDPVTGEAVMMNDPAFLRCGTVLAAAAEAGRRVAFVTAKEKLRALLSGGLVARGGIVFSAECADEARPATHGIGEVEALVGRPRPAIYSGDASLFVLDAGAALVERGRADFLYLSLTDYIQHAHAPAAPEALDFMAAVDVRLGRLLDAGCLVAATADHGMNAKHGDSGHPRILPVETLLHARFGAAGVRVVCPITDPYVAHHGALGGCVMVHVADAARRPAMAAFLARQPGVAEVYARADAARLLELPADRIGDLVVFGDRRTALGKTLADHDLGALVGGLRTHGARCEEPVPFLFSEPLTPAYAERAAAGGVRNFDLFDFACNGAAYAARDASPSGFPGSRFVSPSFPASA